MIVIPTDRNIALLTAAEETAMNFLETKLREVHQNAKLVTSIAEEVPEGSDKWYVRPTYQNDLDPSVTHTDWYFNLTGTTTTIVDSKTTAEDKFTVIYGVANQNEGGAPLQTIELKISAGTKTGERINVEPLKEGWFRPMGVFGKNQVIYIPQKTTITIVDYSQGANATERLKFLGFTAVPFNTI